MNDAGDERKESGSALDSIPAPLTKLLSDGGLSFHKFMERALYDPSYGYYAAPESRANASLDYATSVTISPVFAFAIARLADDFVERSGDALCSIVDIGCGDGSLLRGVASGMRNASGCEFLGIDRSPERAQAVSSEFPIRFEISIEAIPRDRSVLIVSNELFDAFPVHRLVQREHGLNELLVVLNDDGALDWSERPAAPELEEYFRSRGVTLETGQFADISLEWERAYRQICASFDRGLVVTFDYGFPTRQLFDKRIRRHGTVGAYYHHQVHRDVLARPGSQDLTAHINFTDLQKAGEECGLKTLLFTRQNRFLLSIGILEHELFSESRLDVMNELAGVMRVHDARADARRLVLPDGIGEEIRVLVQSKNHLSDGWKFQVPLY